MATVSQRTFAGGELSPSLYARTDVAKYQSAVRTLRNYYVMRHGGATNRGGSKFICEVDDSTKRVRLIPFVFNNEQTYVLEFGNEYIRVIKNGVQLTEAAQAIAGVTQAATAVLTYSGADNYANGDEVYISGVVGMTELNGRNFKVANVDTGANTFELNYMDGTAVNSTAFGAYSSGGTVEEVYQISSPYLEADLQEIQFVQSADVITLTHPSYAPRELSRTGDTSWTLAVIDGVPEIARGTGLGATAGAAGANTYRYQMTAVAYETYEESLPATAAGATLTSVTLTNPAVGTVTSHGYSSGDTVFIDTDGSGMPEIAGKFFIVNVLTANTFELKDIRGNDVDATAYTAYTGGRTISNTVTRITSAAAPSTTNPHVIQMASPPSNAVEFNVYRENSNGVFGWIGVSSSNTFRDTGAVDPDPGDTPPRPSEFFVEDDARYPSVVGYYQQRRLFAASDSEPEAVWASRTGSFSNFTYSRPLQDDDSLSFTLAGSQVNRVKHLIDLGKLVVLTQGGEWAVQGDAAGTLTPSEINARQYTYNGASSLRPLIIGNTALYVQARGNIVRDLGFDISSDGYRGIDLTVYSNHLVDGYQINDWAYAQVPESIVWMVRDDGVLLGLTYVRDQQLLAWHRHDTQGGIIENVCVVPEGNEDVLYWVVKRTVDGKSVRYIERVGSRFVDEDAVEDQTVLDSYLTYDGRNTSATTMTLTSGGGWTYEDTLTLTASASYFEASDVGKEIHLTGSAGDIIRCSITAYTSATVVSVTPNRTVPATMQSTAITDWSYATDVVSGLWHLEGEDVSVFADGYVVANPNNPAYVTVTVADGEVTLDDFYSVIHVGLPITSDLETLDIDTPQGETLADKKQIVTSVTLFLEKTRGLWVGGREPTGSVLDGLTELKIREAEGYDEPVGLLTGKVSVNIESTWNSNGRVFIRQTDPVPSSILAVSPAGLFPVRGA